MDGMVQLRVCARVGADARVCLWTGVVGNEDGREDHRCKGVKVILDNVDREIMDHAR